MEKLKLIIKQLLTLLINYLLIYQYKNIMNAETQEFLLENLKESGIVNIINRNIHNLKYDNVMKELKALDRSRCHYHYEVMDGTRNLEDLRIIKSRRCFFEMRCTNNTRLTVMSYKYYDETYFKYKILTKKDINYR